MANFNLDLDKLNVNIHQFDDDEIQRMIEWLDECCSIEEKKERVLNSVGINLGDENIVGPLHYVIDTIPTNLTPLEKLRYVYISLGHLFSYDYRVIDDIRYATDKVIDMDNCVGRYQTCIQISEIMAKVLNEIDGVEAKVIERKLPNVREEYGQNHVANEVRIKNEDSEYETYLFELTLDLYLIQAGCRTLHFGYESGPNGNYDIIPQVDTDDIDSRINLLSDELYTDDIIKIIKDNISRYDMISTSSKELVDNRIKNMLPLVKTFPGYYEGKQYINMIFKELLQIKYKEFNLYSRNEEITNFKTVFLLDNGDYQKWIMYSNNIGLIATDENTVRNMLETDWETNSGTLKTMLFGEKEKVKRKVEKV